MATANKTYDLGVLATLIDMNGEVRNSKAYKAYKGILIDQTMSCDKEEATNWMLYTMHNCINNGHHGRDDKLRAEFLAAYDLHQHLSK